MVRAVYNDGNRTNLESTLVTIHHMITRQIPQPPNDASGNTDGLISRSNSLSSLSPPEGPLLEDFVIRLLSACSGRPQWHQSVSLTNEYGQNLAHMAVALGYMRLLQHVVHWGIDLHAADITGTTALRLAYLFHRNDRSITPTQLASGKFVLGDLGPLPFAPCQSDVGVQLIGPSSRSSMILESEEMEDETISTKDEGLPVEQWINTQANCRAPEATQPQATSLTIAPINARVMHPTDTGPIGDLTCSSPRVDCTVGRKCHQKNPLGIFNPDSTGAPGNEVQSVTAEQGGGSRPSILQATSSAVSSILAWSACERHHEPMPPISPAQVHYPILVTSPLDCQPTPPPVPVMLSGKTAAQPTTTTEEQHTMHNATRKPTDSDAYHHSISLVSPLPTRQVPLFPQRPARCYYAPMVYMDATDNAMGQIYSNNVSARMPEPPPDYRLHHIPNLEVHEAYKGFVYDLCSLS